jgi:hypothetical protein
VARWRDPSKKRFGPWEFLVVRRLAIGESRWYWDYGLRGFLAAFFARTSALFAAAFLARAVRSSGVIVSRLRFPPIFPAAEPCAFPSFRKYSDTSGGTRFFAISTA